MTIRNFLAWCVHFYTATGLIAAAGIAVLLVRGGDESFRWAFALMLIATVIDTTDGWLARKAEVKKYAAGFDGRRLDDLIDFHTYTTLPLLLIWRAGILPSGFEWILLLPLLASAYGFSQVAAKTNDHFFLGFPSYWNIIAFYLYLLKFNPWISLSVLVILAILTFVPSLYLYTTHGGRFSLSTNLLGSLWALAIVWIMIDWNQSLPLLIWASLIFPIYYFLCSWGITINYWRQKKDRGGRLQTEPIEEPSR